MCRRPVPAHLGNARAHAGCTITNCAVGVSVQPPATALIQHNDVSFNQLGIAVDTGTVRDNIIWGNLDANIETAADVPDCPPCCTVRVG